MIPIILASFLTFNYPQNDSSSLLVFVGEKISVDEFYPVAPEGTVYMDQAFRAKYKVLSVVYGQFAGDTISFEAYDHYGVPRFSDFGTVLLYVTHDPDGKWYHQKYMFNAVYKTVDDRWAGPYDASDYNHPLNINSPVKPAVLSFKDSVWYDIDGLEKEQIEEFYPSPFYRIEGTRAYAVMGNYIEDLFVLKRNGFLTARGLFKRD